MDTAYQNGRIDLSGSLRVKKLGNMNLSGRQRYMQDFLTSVLSQNGSVVGVFLALGLFINSFLHTTYVQFEHTRGVRFGLPYFESPGKYGDEQWGFIGSAIIAIISYILFVIFVEPLTNEFAIQPNIPIESLAIVLLYSLFVVHTSQILAGASFTKFSLDFVVLAISLLLIIAFNNLNSLTFWNVFPTYLTVIFGLISVGGLWVQYRIHNKGNRFLEHEQEHLDTPTHRLVSKERSTQGSFLPTFSVAYFGISAGYLLIGSMILLLSRGGA